MSDDDDAGGVPRTVFAPDPGGMRSARARAQRPEPELGLGPVASAGQDIDIPPHGVNSLVDAASEVLELVVYLRSQTTAIDVDGLRSKLVVLVKDFEKRALVAGEPAKVATVARYAVSATIDDVILSSPWGYDAGWQRKTLVSELHGEVYGGDKFFELLETAKRDPNRFQNLIELMYICLSLGFRGRYWREKERVAELEQTRSDAFRTIDELRGGITDTLSPHWRGVETTRKTLRQFLPTWLIGALGVAAAAALFFGATVLVNTESSQAIASADGMLPDEPVEITRRAAIVAAPPPPTPPEPVRNQIREISEFLEREIAEGIVEPPRTLGNSTLIRIRTVSFDGEAMFGSGRADVQERYRDPIARIAQALENEPGTIHVIGYSDSIPINTARFPNNFELSLARADATRDEMARVLSDGARLRSEGRGAEDPIADNATREGRALNRRIEIVLVREKETISAADVFAADGG